MTSPEATLISIPALALLHDEEDNGDEQDSPTHDQRPSQERLREPAKTNDSDRMADRMASTFAFSSLPLPAAGASRPATDQTFGVASRTLSGSSTPLASRPGEDLKIRYAGTVLEHPLRRVTGQYTIMSAEESFTRKTLSASGSECKAKDRLSLMRRVSLIAAKRSSSAPAEAVEDLSQTIPNELHDPEKGLGFRQERAKAKQQQQQGRGQATPLRKTISLRSDRPRRPSLASDASSEEALLSEEDVEASVEPHLFVRLYVSVGFLLLLTLSDLVSCLVLQLLWAPDDFLCNPRWHPSSGSFRVKWQHGNLAVLCMLLGLHALYILQQLLKADANGRRVGLRYFTSRDLFSTWQLAANGLHLGTCIGSCALLVWHVQLCDEGEACSDCGYLLVRRFHLVLQGGRGLLAVHLSLRVAGNVRRVLQHAVSNTKRRFLDRDAQLDLDLTYIADRLIALSLPCIQHAPYRNDIRDVARFLATRHYAAFVVLNLCEPHEEKGNGNYHPDLLFSQVQRLPMRDHNAPTLQGLVALCEAAADFLAKSPTNVLAVHCQGGKGRTGLFICAVMLWTGFLETAQEAQEYFRRRRTQPGVDPAHHHRIASPSQIRYLKYIEKMVWSPIDPAGFHPLLLHRIRIIHPPGSAPGSEPLMLSVIVERHAVILYDHCKAHGPLLTSDADAQHNHSLLLDVGALLLDGDISLRIYALNLKPHASLARACLGTAGRVIHSGRAVRYGSVKGKLLCFVSLHSAFAAGPALFERADIDGCHKPEDLAQAAFPPSFALALDMARPASSWPLPHAPEPEALSALQHVPAKASSGAENHGWGGGTGEGAGLQEHVTQHVRQQAARDHAAGGGGGVWACEPAAGGDSEANNLNVNAPVAGGPSASGSGPGREGGSSEPEGEWAGQWAGERAVALHEQLLSALHAASTCSGSSGHESYRAGECVRETTGSAQLAVVLSGSVELEVVGLKVGALSLPDDPLLLRFGRGQLLGTLGLSALGLERSGAVVRWRVKSDRALVARLPLLPIPCRRQLSARAEKLQREAEQQQQQQQSPQRKQHKAPCYSEADLCLLYEVVCRQVCSWSYSLARLEGMVQSAACAMADPGQPGAQQQASLLHLHHQVLQHHAIPFNKPVLKSLQASVLEASRRVAGRLVLFADLLLFCPNGGNRARDTVLKLSTVLRARASRDSLTLALRAPDPPPEPPPPPASAPSSFRSALAPSSPTPRSPAPRPPPPRSPRAKNRTASPSRLWSSFKDSASLPVPPSPAASTASTTALLPPQPNQPDTFKSLMSCASSLSDDCDRSSASDLEPPSRPLSIRKSLLGSGRDNALEGPAMANSRERMRGLMREGRSEREGGGSEREGGGSELTFQLQSPDHAKLLQAKIMKLVLQLRQTATPDEECIAFEDRLRRWSFIGDPAQQHARPHHEEEEDEEDEDEDEGGGKARAEQRGRGREAGRGEEAGEEEGLGEADQAALEKLLSRDHLRQFAPGDEVIAVGEVSRRVFFILSGTLHAKAADKTLATRSAGQVVGERMFFDVGNRGATSSVVAATHGEALVVDAHSVEAMADRHPSAGASFYKVLAKVLAQRVQGQLDHLADSDARE